MSLSTANDPRGRFICAILALTFAASTPLANAASGTVVVWGDNSSNQRSPPAGLTGVTAVAAGDGHILALKTDGTVVAWGSSAYNQTKVPAGLSGVVAIAAGSIHSVALKSDGTVVAWGGNFSGQADVPAGLTGVKAIAACHESTVVLKNDGSVVQWGAIYSYSILDFPIGLTGATAVACGSAYALAAKFDGTVIGWGIGYINAPVGMAGVVAVAAGAGHSLALKNDGTVVAWGNNSGGLLNTVFGGQINVPIGLSSVTAVAAGDQHSVALKSDGTVVAWGYNADGQTTVPAGLSGVIAIAAGGANTAAIVGSSGLPAIAIQPQSQTAASGATVTLSVSATGNGLSYQWRKDGVAISGATNQTMTLTSVTGSNAGTYTVVVNNGAGSVTSNGAVLTVTGAAGSSDPVVLASGLTSLSALTSDGDSVDSATYLYFGETIASKTYLRRISASGGTVSTVINADAPFDSGAYRGIHRIELDAIGLSAFGGIGGFQQSYLFSAPFSGQPQVTTSIFSGGALMGAASVDLIYFDQFSRLIAHKMFSNTERVIGTGYYPRAAVDNYIEMYFQNDSDKRIYRVKYDSSSSSSSVSPFSAPMPSLGTLFKGGVTIYLATPNHVTAFSTTTGASTDISLTGTALAADSKFIYFADGGNLKYMPNTGGNSAVLAAIPENSVTGMLVADHYTNPVLYWSQSDGKILKLVAPKTAPAAGASRLINLSILAPLSPDETMTMGTVLGGVSTSGTKALLARAAGPSLTQLGVSVVLPNPAMTLNNTSANPASVVATNTGWGGSAALSAAFASVGAFPYTNAASKDSAIFQPNLAAGNYTVQVRDASGGSGTVIAELYDSTPTSAFTATTPRLINVSVLKQIAAGSSLTAGFVIGGSSANMKVLLRAVGPTLGMPPFNLSGVLANPKLELINNATGQTLNVNLGWGGSTTLSAAFTSVGAFQFANSLTKDCTLLVALSPGQYSARVSGADGGGGTAIVEVYEVP